MSSQIATYEDANLLIKLYELRREDRLREARAWFGANFKPKTLDESNQLAPMGSEQNAYVRMVVSYWEMVSSLMVMCWERVRAFTPQARELHKNPLYLHNLEEACARFEKHLDKRAPGAYAAMAAAMRP